MRDMAQVTIDGGPHGKNTRVTVNGMDVSRYVRRMVIVADVNDAMQVVLVLPAVYVHGEITAEGMVVVDRPPRRRRWWNRKPGRLREVTAFGAEHKVYHRA